jgi:parallel beta-helix repeat protein
MIFFKDQCSASENNIYVDNTHHGFGDGSAENPLKSIQEAINVANEGDIIYIFGGIYDETLVIDKEIKLWGGIEPERGDTIIDSSSDKRYTVEITADKATFEDITISDSKYHKTSPIGALICIKATNVVIQGNRFNNTRSRGVYLDPSSHGNFISGNIIDDTEHGIYVDSSDTNDIFNNIISNCSESAIEMLYSSNSRIYDNYIDNSSFGVHTKGCSNINISNNIIKNNNFYGIFLDQGNDALIKNNNINGTIGWGVYLNSFQCKIIDNTFNANQRGITLFQSSCKIYDNMFFDSTASAIYTVSGTEDNVVYRNHFVGNGMSAQENGNNHWYYENEGNYWDDYNALDRNLDGIGDTYYITGGVDDRYPLGYFLNPPLKPSNPDPADFESDVGLIITLEVDVDDVDSDELTVYFYRADDDSLIGTDERAFSGSTASYSFRQKFDTTFVWYAVANDSQLENRSDIWIFTTRQAPPDNAPPVANAGGPYNAKTYQVITFDASNSYDPDGSISYYRWNFGDGTSELLTKSPDHIYRNPGNYEVTLTVIDDNGTSDISFANVIISASPNQQPIANFSYQPIDPTTEDIIGFIDGSTDLDGNIKYWQWDFGDTSSSSDKYPTHQYEDAGTYIISLTVTDDLGGKHTTSITIDVDSSSQGSPGFELILIIFAASIVILWRRNKKQ